jgi:exosome complex component RRP42
MISEKKFVVDGVRQGLRSDGRRCFSSRTLEIFDNSELLAAGSAQLAISLYSPHIICGVKAEIAEFPQVCLGLEVAGKSSLGFRERLKELAAMIERLVIRYLDTQQLEIIPGKKAWKLFVDVLILQENVSNLLEQISFTVWRALKNTRLIGVVGFVNKNTGEDFLQITSDKTILNLENFPVIISVSLISNTLALDLSDLEELCSDATLHISIDKSGNLKGISKEGHGCLSFSQTCRSLSISKKAAESFFKDSEKSEIQYKLDDI